MAIYSRVPPASPEVVVLPEAAAAQQDIIQTQVDAATAPLAATDSKTDSDKKSVYPDGVYFLWTGIAIVVGAFIGTRLYSGNTGVGAFDPPEGVGIFALFYLIAQVIERMQEPLAPFLGRAKETTTGGEGQGKNQIEAKALLEKELVAARAEPTPDNARSVANKQRTVDQISANLTVLMFGTSALLAMLSLGYLKAGLLDTLGVNNVKAWVEVVASGLIVASGTKPLHDLISKLTASKDADEKADETKP
jgi:hypothetical protein